MDALRQYSKLKAKYPDVVLFFRVGEYFESYHEDALLCARLLGLKVNASLVVPTTGVPDSSIKPYLKHLLEQGYRTALIERAKR